MGLEPTCNRLPFLQGISLRRYACVLVYQGICYCANQLRHPPNTDTKKADTKNIVKKYLRVRSTPHFYTLTYYVRLPDNKSPYLFSFQNNKGKSVVTLSLATFTSRLHSSCQTFLFVARPTELLWREKVSNLRPTGYGPAELPLLYPAIGPSRA